MPRIKVTAKQLGDRHYQINLSDRIAIITQSLLRPGKGGRMARVRSVYFGFAKCDEAQRFANETRRRFPNGRIHVRRGQRLAYTFEVKVSHSCAEEMAWKMLQDGTSASDRVNRHIQQFQSWVKLQDYSTAPVALRGGGRKLARCGDRMVGID